jgi:hypothetical protein
VALEGGGQKGGNVPGGWWPQGAGSPRGWQLEGRRWSGRAAARRGATTFGVSAMEKNSGSDTILVRRDCRESG